jgi:hypothetical protein
MDAGALAFLVFAWGSIFILMYWSISKLLSSEKQQKA